MLNDNELKKILTHAEVLSADDFDKFSLEAKKLNISTKEHLFKKKIITPVVLYESIASYHKLPFIDLKNQTIRKDVLFIVPEPIASTHNIIAFDSNDKEIKIACVDPTDLEIF